MSNSDLSSDSFKNNEKRSERSVSSNNSTVQKLHLQNEELTEQNCQLKKQVESLTKQLNDALSAASAARNIGEQIKTMKQQLNETNSKKEKLSKELKQANATLITTAASLNEQIKGLQQNISNEQAKVKSLEEYSMKIKKERNLLRAALDEKTQLFDVAGEELKKTETTKKKLKAKTASVIERLQESEAKVLELQAKLDQSEYERKELIEKSDSLALQVTSLTAARDEANHNSETMKREVTRCKEAIDELEKHVAEQEKEIEGFAEERPILISFVEKIHKAFAVNENVVAQLQAENAELTKKLKNSAPSQSIASQLAQTRVLDLKFPFEGEIADKCDEILQLQQYTPIQRVQLIINEIARYVEQNEKKCNEVSKDASEKIEEAQRMIEKDNKYGQILASLLKELKERAPKTGDADFIKFVNSKCNKIDVNSLPNGELNQFYNMTDEERRRALKEGKIVSKEQLLINQQNIFGDIQNQQQQTPFVAEQEQMQKSNEDSVASVPDDRDNVIKELQAKIEKLKASKKQIHEALKGVQENNNTLIISEKEAKSQVMRLQTEIDTLKQENEVVKVQLQVAQNELELKAKEENSSLHSASFEQITNAELSQKIEECEKLKVQVASLQEKLNTVVAKVNRKAKVREATLREEIENLTAALEEKDAESQVAAKKFKKAQKKSMTSFKAQVDELQTQLDTTKSTYDETVATLKTKADEAKALSEQLVGSLKECEAKNQKLQDDAAEATKTQKELMTQIITLKQQISKEKQSMRAQLSVQLLAQEAKFQETAAEIREKAEKRSNNILGIAAETIGAFYGIDATSFNEDSFAQLAAHVKSDLDKLRFFQNEMIKYTPNE